MMRLQKFLSHAGVCSRRQAEAYIQEGKVSVNGRVVDRMGVQIDPAVDTVSVSGRVVAGPAPEIHVLLHKPVGYISSCRHSGRKVVLDLVDIKERLYPVGRLDRDSSGLLLLTNNGRLHYRLTHPSFDHEKEYEVETRHPISDEALEKLAEGVVVGGRPTRPARVHRKGPGRFAIVLQEGRNRQIRRMAEAVGNEVTALKRVRMATLRLGDLPPGRWRYLSGAEAAELKRFCGA
jgi:23S rRNA pseudouridine2605 synthase/23S rRNA pseudouridine2604 synthase